MKIVEMTSKSNEKVLELLADAGARAITDDVDAIAVVMLAKERNVLTMWTNNGGHAAATMVGALEILKTDVLRKEAGDL